jgi:hypothetical protein
MFNLKINNSIFFRTPTKPQSVRYILSVYFGVYLFINQENSF